MITNYALLYRRELPDGFVETLVFGPFASHARAAKVMVNTTNVTHPGTMSVIKFYAPSDLNRFDEKMGG